MGVCTPGARNTSAQLRLEMSCVTYATSYLKSVHKTRRDCRHTKAARPVQEWVGTISSRTVPRRIPSRSLPGRGRPARGSAPGRTAQRRRSTQAPTLVGAPRQQQMQNHVQGVTWASFSIRCCTQAHSVSALLGRTCKEHRAGRATVFQRKGGQGAARSPPEVSALRTTKTPLSAQAHTQRFRRSNTYIRCAAAAAQGTGLAPRAPTVEELLLFHTGMPLLVVQ